MSGNFVDMPPVKGPDSLDTNQSIGHKDEAELLTVAISTPFASQNRLLNDACLLLQYFVPSSLFLLWALPVQGMKCKLSLSVSLSVCLSVFLPVSVCLSVPREETVFLVFGLFVVV